MEVKHTPLPWKAENGESRGAWIMGSDECWAALVCGDNDSTAIANKDFIVRACNSHYELLKVCKVVLATLPHMGGSERATFHLVKDLEAAIAKAEGRS